MFVSVLDPVDIPARKRCRFVEAPPALREQLNGPVHLSVDVFPQSCHAIRVELNRIGRIGPRKAMDELGL